MGSLLVLTIGIGASLQDDGGRGRGRDNLRSADFQPPILRTANGLNLGIFWDFIFSWENKANTMSIFWDFIFWDFILYFRVHWQSEPITEMDVDPRILFALI